MFLWPRSSPAGLPAVAHHVPAAEGSLPGEHGPVKARRRSRSFLVMPKARQQGLMAMKDNGRLELSGTNRGQHRANPSPKWPNQHQGYRRGCRGDLVLPTVGGGSQSRG